MDIEESGHTDVASAKNQVKVAMSALEKMRTELGKLGDEGSLPSWWTNKVAIAVDKLDGMADYLDTQVEENKMKEENELDEVDESVQRVANALSVHIDKKQDGELDEAMDKNAKLKIFNKLKKGDKIKIKYDSSFAKGKDYTTFVVTRNMSVVGKAKVEKIPLAPEGKTGGMKYYLYNRDGNVSFAMGDMGASIVDMKEELSKIKGNTPADQGRRGAVEDDIKRAEKRGDKKAVAKLKEDELDEKRADFIRLSFNSPADVKKVEKWIDQNLSQANQGFTGMYREGQKDIAFEDVDDADELMSKLKKAGFRFKLDYRESVELDEKTKWKMGDGRPRGGSHIENERFWDLPKDSLEYIIKDAGDAMKANPKARKATTGRGNWADQVNDAQTVLGWRKKNGIKEESELDEVIPKSTMYGVVVKGKFIAKGSKANMRKLAKEKGGKLYNSPRAKVGDSVGKSEEVELDEAKYEYDGKVVKISKKEFAKVSKDYKNSTKGKERMMILDPKTQGSISVPVQFEEAELDEQSKDDFEPHMMYDPKTGKEYKADTYEDHLRMKEMGYVHEKPKMKEEVDENVQRVANAISHHEARKMSPSARARQDALRDIGKDKSKDDDEVKATDADRERADRNILTKLKKSVDVKGNYEIKFDKGPSKKIPYKFVKFALAKHAKMKPADKLKFQKQAEKSYVDFLKALKDM